MPKKIFIILFVFFYIFNLFANKAQENTLYKAIRSGNLNQIKNIIEKDPQLINIENELKESPLIYALSLNKLDIAEYLINNGADVNKVDINGISPLMISKERDYKKIINMLLEKGAVDGSTDIKGGRIIIKDIEIPEGINYVFLTEDEVLEAAEKLMDYIQDEDENNISIFYESLICAPFLWNMLKKDTYFMNAEGVIVRIPVSVLNDIVVFKGMTFKEKETIKKFSIYLKQTIKKDQGFVIRLLEEEELKIYNAMTPYNINEPVFIIETKSHKFLVDFIGDEIFYLDDLKGINIYNMKYYAR